MCVDKKNALRVVYQQIDFRAKKRNDYISCHVHYDVKIHFQIRLPFREHVLSHMDPLERSTTQGNAFVLEDMEGGKRTCNTLSSFPLYPVQSHARVPIIEEFLSTTMRACERNLRLQIPTSTSFVLFQFCRQHASFDFCRSLRTFFLWNEPGWPCHHGSVGGPPVEPTCTHRRDRHAGKKIKDAQLKTCHYRGCAKYPIFGEHMLKEERPNSSPSTPGREW